LGSLVESASAPCIFGDVNASTTVVLMGDSHAEHWLPAMDAIGQARHWKVYAMVKPACPVADLPQLMNRRLKRFYTECAEWRTAKLKKILELKPNFVVLSSYDHYVPMDGQVPSWSISAADWQVGLRRTYALLSHAGIKTIAMRDVPDIGFDAPSCLSRQASRAPFKSACTYDLRSSLHRRAIEAQTAAARGLANVSLVSMNDRVCSRSPCSVVQRESIVYRDDDHITATFSRAEASVLGARLIAALADTERRF
jgi:hypothetical protein